MTKLFTFPHFVASQLKVLLATDAQKRINEELRGRIKTRASERGRFCSIVRTVAQPSDRAGWTARLVRTACYLEVADLVDFPAQSAQRKCPTSRPMRIIGLSTHEAGAFGDSSSRTRFLNICRAT